MPTRDQVRALGADRVVKSVCPYCAVGCAQNVFVKDDRVTQIEGDPDAPHSRGRLCPKGSATLQLTTGASREQLIKTLLTALGIIQVDLQLLLGNMGRPGGGVMAMRGYASIQGSSDIPTLFDTHGVRIMVPLPLAT
jgi:anaerobic selenocysteine-containing dehydrogenase